MNRVIKIIFILFTFININQLVAQGFTFDKEQYAKRETVESTRGALPSYISLKKYTPIIYPQESGNCVAQSFSNSLNILLAKELNLTDKTEITLLRPSPFFIYYTYKYDDDFDCSEGLDGEKVAIGLLNNGVVPMISVEYPNYYPFTSSILCGYYPPSYLSDLVQAEKIKPTNIYKIETLSDIKTALANGMPVVIGMMVPESFKYCNSYVWSPTIADDINKSFGHAMTVVGYDDNLYGGSFEIMNSWGEDWGVNGYTRVRYSDAVNWIVAGWAVEKKTSTTFNFNAELDKKDEKLYKNEEMVKIFSESRKDSLIVNPFFQRNDLDVLIEKLLE